MTNTPSARHNSREYSIDIEVARRVSDVVQTDTDFFILTGSYSIEALTGGNIAHNDVDANVFTPNIPRAMARVGLLLDTSGIIPHLTRLEATKPNRLEYRAHSDGTQRDVELQFIEFKEVRDSTDGLDFVLHNESDRKVVVPVVKRPLETVSGESVDFYVKSLPFAIATWALRISNVAEAQKRAVRQTDIDHFKFLVDAPHDTEKVIWAMERHPQMPANYVARDALAIALDRINNTKD